LNKHYPLRASGSDGLRHLVRRDVTAGTHAHLTVCTRMWNPFQRHLTHQLDQKYMPKYHDDSTMGYASLGRNDLPHVRFSSVGTEATDGVDQLYHQLAEIHAIAATQLAECVR
jgi:predicted lipoprotein with Yx(FWY)xxD motif